MRLGTITALAAISILFASLICAAAEVVLDVDCGGPTDYRNTLVVGSRKKLGNGVTPVAGTTEDDRFKTYRFTLSNYDEFTYNLQGLPDGEATLILEFVEYTWTVCQREGDRVFSVAVDDVVVLQDLNVYKVGGNRCRVAVVEELPVTISGGELNVKFIRGASGNPMISGIKVDAEGTVLFTTTQPATTTTTAEVTTTMPSDSTTTVAEVTTIVPSDPATTSAEVTTAMPSDLKTTTAEVTTTVPSDSTTITVELTTTVPSDLTTTSVSECHVVSGTDGGSDHRAHSVPGSYPPKINADSAKSYVDTDGDGFQTVLIDGSGSHTHFQDFSDEANPIPGTVISYTWTMVETDEVVSTEISFSYDFPLGVTRLALEIQDSTCDIAIAETTVTVTGAISPGAYCYYYDSDVLPEGHGLNSDGALKPTFAFEHVQAFEGSIPEPPASFRSEVFAARCFVLYESDAASEATVLSVSAGGTGIARLYRSSELVVEEGASTDVVMPAGLLKFEVQFVRTAAEGAPELSLLVNGTAAELEAMSYDRSMVLPVLESVTPTKSPSAGGGDATFTGYGFFSAPFVSFGGAAAVQASENGLTPTEFTVEIPSSTTEGIVEVTAASGIEGLSSNSLSFEYGQGVEEVKFTQEVVTLDGETFSASLTTCVAVFGDSWYLGRVGGVVRKVTVSADWEVTDSCDSEALSDPAFSKNGIPSQVDILGIAFDPRDTIGKPYVTAATLHWFHRRVVDSTNMDAWQNGRIERLAPSPGGGCLVVDERVVSGLPVADHDHGPSGIDFDNDGNFYVTSAGVTNGGLPGAEFGNVYETPLSAAILKFNPSDPDFDGTITYSENYANHQNAQKLTGDISVYASGLRNSFDLAFTSRGELYATDNGPNIFRADGDPDGYGRFSVECEDILPIDGAPAESHPDKIVQIVEGGYYGHPNPNRGVLNGVECPLIDPISGNDFASPPRDPSAGYESPLFTVTSSVNGMMEYTASHFNGDLKGELLATTFANAGFRPIYRVRASPPRLLTLDRYAALSLAQGAWGEIILPKYGGDFQILQPDYAFPSSLSARVVTPFRGGAGGGQLVTITGHNFGTAPTVEFNGIDCPLSGSVTTTSRGDMLKCTTPASGGAVNLVDVAVTSSGSLSTITDGFMYMNN